MHKETFTCVLISIALAGEAILLLSSAASCSR